MRMDTTADSHYKRSPQPVAGRFASMTTHWIVMIAVRKQRYGRYERESFKLLLIENQVQYKLNIYTTAH